MASSELSPSSQLQTHERHHLSDQPFVDDDLLEFFNDEEPVKGGITDNGSIADSIANNAVSSTASLGLILNDNVESSSSSTNNFSGGNDSRNLNDVQFPDGLFLLPEDDIAELEWLASFTIAEDNSFSNEDLQKLQIISGIKPQTIERSSNTIQQQLEPYRNDDNNPIFNSDVSVPAKARSKRSRPASQNWNSPPTAGSPTKNDIIPGPLVAPLTPPNKRVARRKESPDNGEGRRCLHCDTDKTPQWRTGPMGPKTLCNACGVRYKSGRLVPEYRPAASPTFTVTKHSNSHRKVMELRRQKEIMHDMMREDIQMQMQHHYPQRQQQSVAQNQHQSMLFNMPNGDDHFLVRHHLGVDFGGLF